jgi:hypothetical protein
MPDIREEIATELFTELEPYRPSHAKQWSNDLTDQILDILKKNGWVELPDVSNVSEWLEVNKSPVKITMSLVGNEIKLQDDGDKVQSILLTKFCMAVKSGRVKIQKGEKG